MSTYVTDTHGLIWHLTASDQLSATCRAIFEAADRGEAKIWIPSIVLVETVYLAEKARFPSALAAAGPSGASSSPLPSISISNSLRSRLSIRRCGSSCAPSTPGTA